MAVQRVRLVTPGRKDGRGWSAGGSASTDSDEDAVDTGGAADESVAVAARSGSRRELLIAMRDRVAESISDPDCPPRDLAALTRRLQDIAKDLEQLELLESSTRSVVAGTGDEPFTASSV